MFLFIYSDCDVNLEFEFCVLVYLFWFVFDIWSYFVDKSIEDFVGRRNVILWLFLESRSLSGILFFFY